MRILGPHSMESRAVRRLLQQVCYTARLCCRVPFASLPALTASELEIETLSQVLPRLPDFPVVRLLSRL